MKVALSIAAVLLAVNLVRANPVNPCANGLTFNPYQGDIHKFIICSNGEAYAMDCPAGTQWDQSQLVCDREPSNVVVPQTAAPVVVPETAAPPAFVCNVNDFKGDECDPNVFYKCADTNPDAGVWVKMSCGTGTHWSQTKKECDHTYIVNFIKPDSCP